MNSWISIIDDDDDDDDDDVGVDYNNEIFDQL